MDAPKMIEILLIEDNDGDARLIQEALTESKIFNNLNRLSNGSDALKYLLEHKQNHKGLPDIILLDLNLPGIDGREILSTIKKDEQLKQIPVVILTSSNLNNDIKKSYEMHANCYITKPLDLEQFNHVVQSINGFWFSVVKLPENE